MDREAEHSERGDSHKVRRALRLSNVVVMLHTADDIQRMGMR